MIFTVVSRLRLQLHSAIYRADSFVLMLRYCANLKVIRDESTSFNRIVADKSHRVIVALRSKELCQSSKVEYDFFRHPTDSAFLIFQSSPESNVVLL